MAQLPDVTALGPRRIPSPDIAIARQPTDVSAGALSDLGAEATRIGNQFSQQQDEAAVLDARNQANDWEAANLHDPNTGAVSKKGKDAFGLTETVPAAFDQFKDKALAGLSNARQRRLVTNMLDSRRAQVQAWVGSYVGEQQDVYNQATYAAGMQSSRTRVMNDPATVNTELAVQSQATAQQIRRKLGASADPQVVDSAVQGVTADLNGAVIDGMLSRNEYQQAYDYFDSHRASLGTRADDYGQKVKAARLVVESTQNSDRIIAQYGTGLQALGEAKKIGDPFLRKAVEDQINHEADLRQVAQERGEQAVRRNASVKQEASDATLPIESVFNAQELAQINQQPGLREQLVARQKDRLRGTEVETVPAVLDRYRTLMGTDPNAFAAADITKDYPRLSIAARDYLERSQQEIKDPSKRDQFATEDQVLRRAYDELGAGNMSASDREAMQGTFFPRYLTEKQAFFDQHKRPPNAEEMTQLTKRLELPFVQAHPEWYRFNQTGPLYSLDRSQGGTLQVPEDARAQIVDSYQRLKKRAPTEVEILQTYLKSAQ